MTSSTAATARVATSPELGWSAGLTKGIYTGDSPVTGDGATKGINGCTGFDGGGGDGSRHRTAARALPGAGRRHCSEREAPVVGGYGGRAAGLPLTLAHLLAAAASSGDNEGGGAALPELAGGGGELGGGGGGATEHGKAWETGQTKEED
uniref:DUF834 domain-containing protein n=1 Tax=Oryza sativa subsp. japonica TaxID=39947 RepID=Q6YTM9_ORYSJ|nr:hypothetical protein [Oryza sativa Japonica Group]